MLTPCTRIELVEFQKQAINVLRGDSWAGVLDGKNRAILAALGADRDPADFGKTRRIVEQVKQYLPDSRCVKPQFRQTIGDLDGEAQPSHFHQAAHRLD